MKHRHEDWFTYYKDHKNISPSNIFLHWEYLFNIMKGFPKSLLEIGCGPADHSMFLLKLFPWIHISLIDLDIKIINLLKKRHKNKINKYYICDVMDQKEIINLKFKENQFDVVYSQGLMEHFTDNELKKVITNFLPYTKKMIFSIPGENYPSHDYGDEILRNKNDLDRILKQIPKIKFKVKKYFPDIGIRTKVVAVRKIKRNLLEKFKFLFINGCHYLIEIKKTND